ncbi:hypothetical protein ACQ4PT_055579 [Festuca glaucescens]
MDYLLTSNALSVWFAIAFVSTIAVATKMAATRRRTAVDSPCMKPSPPPMVSGIALLGLLLRVFRKGPEAAIEGLHAKLGDVFTVSFLFGQKVTFLIGQEAYFSKWEDDGIVDLKHEIKEVLMLISARCLLGKEVREKMFDEFRTLFREIENCVSFVSVFFPYIPIPAHRRRDSALLKITETLSEIVKSRRRSGGTEEDMMHRLIDSKYKDGWSMTEAEITGMIMTLLFAGKLTSAHTSTWTGACIVSSTKCLTAVVEEQKKIIGKYNDQVDYNVLLEMDTLHNCIKEALRLHPSAPMLVRNAHKHFTVLTKQGNEYDIPKGHTLASPVVLNNSMPHIYKDSDVYDPDRFCPDRAEDKAGGKFSYTSFGGGGNHGCFGEAYAYMQIKIIWSYLLRNFDLKLMSPFPKPDWSKFVLLPRGKVLVSYKRRQLPSTYSCPIKKVTF